MNGNLIRRCATGVVIAAVLVIIGVIGVALWLRFSDGPRPDISDLEPLRDAIPDSENGFLVLGWIDRMVRDQAPDGKWLLQKEWDPTKVDALLAANVPPMAVFDEALAKPGFQWEKIEPGNYGLKIHSLQHLLRLKTLSAVKHWKQMEKTSAFEEALQALRAERRVETSGVAMSHFLTIVYVQTQTLNVLCRFSDEATDTERAGMESALAQLEQDVDHTAAYRNALKNEMAYFNLCFDEFTSRKKPLAVFYGDGWPLPSTEEFLFQPNNTHAMFAETFRQLIREAPLTYDKTDKEPGAFKVLMKIPPNKLLLSLNAGGRRLFFHSLPKSVEGMSKKCRIITQVGMTRALIATRLYWLDHGKLPATLDELVPAYLKSVPVDAFDGKSLRYSPLNKVIYSVGSYQTDLGGDFSDGNKDGDRQPTVKIEW